MILSYWNTLGSLNALVCGKVFQGLKDFKSAKTLMFMWFCCIWQIIGINPQKLSSTVQNTSAGREGRFSKSNNELWHCLWSSFWACPGLLIIEEETIEFFLMYLPRYIFLSWLPLFTFQHTRCSRGCSTNNFVNHYLTNSLILCGNIFNTFLLPKHKS